MIVIKLDRVMKDRGIDGLALSQLVGITPANISILRTGKAKAIRFSTLAKLCEALNCQPGDILTYNPSDEFNS